MGVERGQGQYKGRSPKAPLRLAEAAGEGMPISSGIMRPQRVLGRERA
jgi:hypothetical protein